MRYYEDAVRIATDYTVIVQKAGSNLFEELISNHALKRLGVEGGSISYARYKKLAEKHNGLELVDIDNAIERMRRTKSVEEIEKIQRAQNITDGAFLHLLNVIKPDMTELEVAAELEYAMKRSGAELYAFETVAISGALTSVPHGHSRNTKLQRGFLTLDFGAILDGYCSDMTRTIVVGRADADMRKLYDTVLRAQAAAEDYLLRGGRDCASADKVARDIIDADYPGAFTHSLGHGVGLEVHETPSLSPKSIGSLAAGDVVTIEPGIYLAGKYGCRIEDMVAIQEDGIINFTSSTKDLIEIF
jgi:Xaa-Pro aminopeptidase